MNIDKAKLVFIVAAMCLAGLSPASAGQPDVCVDVCVYGATPSGILAAIAVGHRGHSVVIVEPSRWVGGILGAGLKPTQDCPNIHATGGLTRELLTTLGQPKTNEDGTQPAKRLTNAQLSPKAIREDFQDLLTQHEIRVVLDHRVNTCQKDGLALRDVTFDLAPFDCLGCPVAKSHEVDALRVTAAIFIDATYEGDLMACAGISYRVGREAASEFNEQQAGVQSPMELAPIDPFVVPGDPNSGLLAWVEDDHGKSIGDADGYTQAYNYRYYTTDDPNHRLPLTPPADYDASQFELVGRYVQYLTETIADEQELYGRLGRIFPGWANSGVWNYHRESLFSMAPLGISQQYADGDYAAKARVWKQHQDYLRGLHHFMSSDSRVPATFRRKTAALGLDRRHHPDTQGWPHQLYVRVSRRLAGCYTITAHDVYNRTTIDDPIGLAQYGIDTYPSRRIWLRAASTDDRSGSGGEFAGTSPRARSPSTAADDPIYVGLEGKMFIGGARGPTNVPYPIPYRAIIPKADQCTNLLVPICFSATHLGYASARMEPVFMICGESAGIAACQSLAENTPVQQIDRLAYRKALDEAGQVLRWTDELAQVARQASSADAYTFDRLCQACDTDGDRLVTRDEWSAGKPGWAWLFPLIDTNEDGHVVSEEYTAFQAFKKQNPNWPALRPQEIN